MVFFISSYICEQYILEVNTITVIKIGEEYAVSKHLKVIREVIYMDMEMRV